MPRLSGVEESSQERKIYMARRRVMKIEKKLHKLNRRLGEIRVDEISDRENQQLDEYLVEYVAAAEQLTIAYRAAGNAVHQKQLTIMNQLLLLRGQITKEQMGEQDD